jgi:hypothetical protein
MSKFSSQRITMMEAHCPSAGHDNTPNQRLENLLCYRIIPAQAQPARFRLLQFLVFLLRFMLLGLLSLVNRATLNQRAVGSPPTRPTKFFNDFRILPMLR